MTNSSFHRVATIGVDVGRVLIHPGDPSTGADTSFLQGSEDDALATPPMPFAIESLARLVVRFEGRVRIVSKCGPRVAARTLRWFEHQDVYARTGLDPGSVYFCRERKEKAVHAARLGLTHFVDDRLDVLAHLEGIVPFRFLFGPQRPGTRIPDDVVPTPSWREALAAIEASPADVLD